jgi:hypothetical protein
MIPNGVSFGANTAFDIVLIVMGGLPLILPLLWCAGETRLAQAVPFDYLWWANQIFSMPHVFATYARLNRKIGEKRVSPIFGWPGYAAILSLMIFATCHSFVLYVLTAVNIWQSYHYVRQAYGVSRFFARPDGETELERKLCFWAYHAAMPLFVLGRWNMLFIYWHGNPSDAIIPVAFPAPVMAALWTLGVVALGIGLACEVLKWRRACTERAVYNAAGLLSLIVFFFIHWYGFLSVEWYSTGFAAVTIWHAVQYLSIAWRMEDRQKSSNGFQTKLLRAVPVSLSFIAFCLALYFFGDFVQSNIFILGNGWWPQFAATAMSSISAHHYLVDTVLWGRKSGI